MAECTYHGEYNGDGPGATDYCPACESGELPTEVVFISDCCDKEFSPPYNPNSRSNIVHCSDCGKGYWYLAIDKGPRMKETEN